MYGKARAQNAKARLADSYTELLHQIWAGSGDCPLKSVGLYNIIKPLAQGSFGTVYLGVHKLTKTKVVLKSASKDQPNLVREIFHHRQFRHPHIATLYEVIVTENTVWLAMEYCQGNELYQYMIDHGRLKQDQVKRIFSQLVGAVAYTHSKNCAHRDLKLENTLLDRDFNVKLADFGFTREYQSRVMLETVCGTVCYMAPEMISRAKYHGHSIDIWSLGVILYTLLYGEMPFEEETDDETKTKILFEEPKYVDPSVPAPAQLLVQRMLSKDPKDRPSLSQILENPYLEEFACTQRTILVNSQKERKLFSSKSEKRVLRALKAAHFDLHEIAMSVTAQKCDALSALWDLTLAKQIKADAKRSHRPSLSIPKYVRRDAPLSGMDYMRSPLFRSSAIESESELAESDKAQTTRLRPSIKHRSLSATDPKQSDHDDRRIVTAPSSPVARLSFSASLRNSAHHDSLIESRGRPDEPRRSVSQRSLSKLRSSALSRSNTLTEPLPIVEQAHIPSPNPSVKSTRSSVITRTKELKSHLKTAIMRFIVIGRKGDRHQVVSSNLSPDPSNLATDNLDPDNTNPKYANVTGIRSMTSSGNSLIPDKALPHRLLKQNKSSNLRFDVKGHPQSFPDIPTQATVSPSTNTQQQQKLMQRQRPVSQISTLTNFSQLSFSSTITNNTKKKSHRPQHSRRSTSSSISSVVSRNHHRSRSSCSSASIHSTNSNGDDMRAMIAPASVSSPILRSSTPTARKFHESAVLSSAPIAIAKRRRSPFSNMYSKRKIPQQRSARIEEDIQEIEL